MGIAAIENINIEGVEYFSFPIDEAIEQSSMIATGFYIPLGPKKNIRIELEGNISQKLLDYKNKGLKNILMVKTDYDRFLWRHKRGLSIFIFNELEEAKPLNDLEVFKILRKAAIYIGLSAEVIKICEPLVRQNLKLIRTTTNAASLFKTFISECQEQYIFNLFKSYICVALAKELNLPPHIYNKFIQVNLLCDLGLNAEDYESYYLNPNDSKMWTKNYKDHPKDMASFIQRHLSNLVGPEVIKWVDLHEESPDGSGFPYGMKAGSFDQTTSIIIVSRLLTKELLNKEFLYDNRKDFLNNLVLKKISASQFKITRMALYRIMNLVDNEEIDKSI